MSQVFEKEIKSGFFCPKMTLTQFPKKYFFENSEDILGKWSGFFVQK